MSFVIIVDKSESKNISVYSVLIINDSEVKFIFNQIKGWVKHSKKLGQRKYRYYKIFLERFKKLKIKIKSTYIFVIKKGSRLPDKFWNIIDEHISNSQIIIVDDKLVSVFIKRYSDHKTKIRSEGKVNDKIYKKLILLADNIANLIRLYKQGHLKISVKDLEILSFQGVIMKK